MSEFEAPFDLQHEWQIAELERLDGQATSMNERIQTGEIDANLGQALVDHIAELKEELLTDPDEYLEHELRAQRNMEIFKQIFSIHEDNKPNPEEE